jgi:dolichol-phosphate mannosyltransferase
MDCDLQDNPAEIPKLYHQTLNEYKIILAKRMNRKDAFIKKWTSFIFWKLIAFLTQTPIHPLVGNFGMYHKNVIAQFIASKDTEPYFSIAMQKFNFPRVFVDVKHQSRQNEKSSYSLSKLLKHAANILIHTHKSLLEKPSASTQIIHYTIEEKLNLN